MKSKLLSFGFTNTLVLLGAIVLLGFGALIVSAALLANAQEPSEVGVVIHNANGNEVSSAPEGATIHTHALVEAAGDATTTPTGTVDFSRYQNESCDGTASVEENVELDQNGEAQSENATLGENGLSYRVHYDGDEDHEPGDSDCESVSADPADASIDLSLSTTTILVGGEARASAELSGETDDADGTVIYTVYSNSSCTQNARDAGTKDVEDGEVDDSNLLTFNDTGDFFFRAVYSGDEDNEAATSSCSDNRLLVVATSTPNDDDDDDGDGDGDDDDDNDKPHFFKKFLPPGIFKKIFDDDFRMPPGIMKKFDGDFFENIFNKNKIFSDDDEDGDDDDDDDDDEDNWRNKGRSHRGR